MAQPIDDQVVDDPAALVREQRVLRLAVGEPFEVVREHRLEELPGRRALDVELPHVRDVERARARANREMLRDHPLVLHGHLPPGERHEARARRDVAVEERRPTERRVHGRETTARGQLRRARIPTDGNEASLRRRSVARSAAFRDLPSPQAGIKPQDPAPAGSCLRGVSP